VVLTSPHPHPLCQSVLPLGVYVSLDPGYPGVSSCSPFLAAETNEAIIMVYSSDGRCLNALFWTLSSAGATGLRAVTTRSQETRDTRRLWYKQERMDLCIPSEVSSPSTTHSPTPRYTIMVAVKTVLGAAVLLASQVLAETHTVSFDNRCGFGTVSLQSYLGYEACANVEHFLADFDPGWTSAFHRSTLHRERPVQLFHCLSANGLVPSVLRSAPSRAFSGC
jgi:hypothetical protein